MRKKIFNLTKGYLKSKGKAYVLTKAFLKYKKKVFITNFKTPTLYSMLKKYGIPLSETMEITEVESFDPRLMVKVKEVLPQFKGFKAPRLTAYMNIPNSITGDTDWTQVIIVSATRPLGEREQLVQLFLSCPKGSYGHYAGLILRLIEPLVGDFASDAIHLFFAEIIDEIAELYTHALNVRLSTKETERWSKSEDPLAREAGTVIREKGRQRSIQIAVLLDTFLNGKSYAKLLEQKKVTALDSQIRSEVKRVVAEIDKQVAESAEQDKSVEEQPKEQDKVGGDSDK